MKEVKEEREMMNQKCASAIVISSKLGKSTAPSIRCNTEVQSSDNKDHRSVLPTDDFERGGETQKHPQNWELIVRRLWKKRVWSKNLLCALVTPLLLAMEDVKGTTSHRPSNLVQ